MFVNRFKFGRGSGGTPLGEQGTPSRTAAGYISRPLHHSFPATFCIFCHLPLPLSRSRSLSSSKSTSPASYSPLPFLPFTFALPHSSARKFPTFTHIRTQKFWNFALFCNFANIGGKQVESRTFWNLASFADTGLLENQNKQSSAYKAKFQNSTSKFFKIFPRTKCVCIKKKRK